MIYFSILLTCVVSGILTYYINHFTSRGPVFATGIVTLSAGIVLPVLFPNFGASLALAATCASYAGMAARSRIRDFWDMTLCSVLTAVLFVLTQGALVGIGGRLGTIAAIAVVCTWGLRQFLTPKHIREVEDVSCKEVAS